MNTDRLFHLLTSIHPLSAEVREALEDVIRSVSFPKGHYLVQAQTPAHHAYFLERGFAVAFQYKLNKRVVTSFWKAGELILSPASFFQQVASEEIVQVSVDSDLLLISYSAFKSLSDRFPVMDALARNITVNHYARCKERVVDLHTLDAWQRYLKLVAAFPGIDMNVAQELIASYLGITPQSLSRLKSEHS